MDRRFITDRSQVYYESENELLLHSECTAIMDLFPPDSIDMIFADPPYFLSNGGITCQGGKMVSVNKGDWDTGKENKDEFNLRWIKSCRRILKPNGTIWISGTFHNIFSIGHALEANGFTIINNIIWQKTNPPPNLACKCFTHSTETIIWARKNEGKHYFNYELMKKMNDGKQMRDVWAGRLTPQKEKTCGKHPTQKPLYLLERILLASTREGDIVLDPFAGTSTTGVAAKHLHRRYIGVDITKEYLEISKKRLTQELL